MAINKKINEYLERIMHTRESENAYRLTKVRMSAYLGNEPSCAIKRGGVSAQLKDNLMHVIEQNKLIMYDNQINQSIIKNIYMGPPPKPVYFCMN